MLVMLLSYIRDLHQIRKSLFLDLAKQIAMALVSSKVMPIAIFTICMPENDTAR